MFSALNQRLRTWVRKVDLYVVRGLRHQQRTNLILFWWYGVFMSLSSAFVEPYVTIYALAYGASHEQIGLIAALSNFFGMVVPIPGAQWAAKRGKYKPVILTAYGLRRVMLFLALLVPLFLGGPMAAIAIIILFSLRAAFLHLGFSTFTAFTGLIIPLDSRGRYFSTRKSIMAAVGMLAVPLAGWLIGKLQEPQGYQISFFISIVFGVVALYVFGRISEPKSLSETQSAVSMSGFINALTQNRTFLYFALISMLFNVSWQLSKPYFGVYNVEVLGSTPQIIGILSISSSLAQVVGQQFFGRLIDRKGARWTFSLVVMLLPLLPFIWLPLTNPWQVVLVYVPTGLLFAGRNIAIINLLWTLPDEETQTQAIASYYTLISLANVLGPLAGGQVLNLLGYKWLFGISGLGRFIAFLLFIWLLKPFSKQKARAEM